KICPGLSGILAAVTNPSVVKLAFTKLAHLRNLPSFLKFKKIEDVWQNTYNAEYEYLYALFRNASKGETCNCNVYQDGRFNVPPYQDDLDEIGRDVREYESFVKTELIYVRCRICRKEWEVEVDSYYHYPHSH
ncbi:MAG: hypothetical protein P1Q69_09685, partial [Candidatus Thorarchaeota archaeon]|nr:hypothetical protein [Candidatus Thorarchaeota archaeon]